MGHIIVYVTNPTKKTADRIAMHLLKKKLIACANIFHVDSIYWWKGEIEKAKEWVVIAKSTEKDFEKIKKEVKRLHPYDVPDITKIKVTANQEYEKWLKEETK